MNLLRRTAAQGLAAALIAGTLLSGCGNVADPTKAQVRLVNAAGPNSGYAQLDLRIDDQLRQSAVAYGSSADYVEVDPKKAATTVTQAGSTNALLSLAPSLEARKHYTVLAFGTAGGLGQVTLDEDQAAPSANNAMLRVLNAASDAGALDIYVIGNADPLATATALQAGAAANTLNGWITRASGSVRLVVTSAGDKADVRLDLPNITLDSRQVATLVLSPGRGGVLVNALLVTQQGAITRLDNTQARARVVAGLSGGAAVTVRLGGQTLVTAVSAPVIDAYKLVPAGAALAYVLEVDGAALPSQTATLLAGGDYTLLAYGSPAAPKLAPPITDDNTVPANSLQAKVRLVNGVGGLSNPLAMKVDLTVRADNVAAGSASPYAGINATSSAQIVVTTAGVTAPLLTASAQALTAGAVYTVFVLGDASAVTTVAGVLKQDR